MRVFFDFANSRISIEGDAPELLNILQAAREIAPSLPSFEIDTQLGNAPPRVRTGTEKNGGGTPNGDTHNSHQITQTMRQFARSLSLTSSMERIAAIAYYQKYHEDNQTFSPKDMSNWFTHCGFQKPSQMPVTFSDTKRNKGYIESQSRGIWRITTQGENLIINKLESGDSEE